MMAASSRVNYPTAPPQQHPQLQQLPYPPQPPAQPQQHRQKSRGKRSEPSADSAKRRCVSTACVACRKRKSKCDGNTPACAACSSVYGTECVYDPNSDLRRKGVYRQDIDNLKDRGKTLQTLIEAILNYPQDEVSTLVGQIRNCQSLETLASRLSARDPQATLEDLSDAESPVAGDQDEEDTEGGSFEAQLSSKLGQLRVEAGSTRFFGGTSNLVFQDEDVMVKPPSPAPELASHDDPITSWTTVTADRTLVVHLLNMYFTWHYTFFVTLSKSAFYRHFLQGRLPAGSRRRVDYCTPLLVNAMLALGCHFTARPGACEDPSDPSTAGDHFFKEAKRLIMEEEEYEHPRLATVQALALMSVREAGCGREAKGWAYSGIAFRMACDLGLNLDAGGIASKASSPDEQEEDARRMTFWGCFLFDKCWSNYLGRLPHFQSSVNITCPKFDVFPDEEAGIWSPYSDDGASNDHSQPSRIRTVATHLMDLCDISSDLMKYFYHPQEARNPPSKQTEIKRLGEIHTRLENWKRELPSELESREGALPSVLVMHMFFHLLYIHLFRPFLKYAPKTSPLPSNVSPRRQCTHGATNIAKLMRLYKRSYGMRQICNIVVYIAHSACTIHLLNLPDKNARRDINHGVKQLEEISSSWPCAKRTLGVLSMQARKWKVELPEEAAAVLQRAFPEYAIDTPGSGSPQVVKSAASPGSATSQSSQKAPPAATDFDVWAGGADLAMDTDDITFDDLDLSFDSLMQQQPGQFAFATSHPSDTSTIAGGPSSLDERQHSTGYNSAFASPPTSGQLSPAEQGVQFWTRPGSGSVSTPLSSSDLNGFQHAIAATASPTQQQFSMPNYASMHPPPVPQQSSKKRPSSTQSQQPKSTPQSFSNSQRHGTSSSRPKQPPPVLTNRANTNADIKNQGRRASATDSMFGGVQALLSESHDFWLRDQSKMATGFGNWRSAAAAAAAAKQQPSHHLDTAQSPTSSNASSVTPASVPTSSSTASRPQQHQPTPTQMDRQCGVPIPTNTPGSSTPCAGPLDCDLHATAAKRTVPGRSRPFDALMGQELARRWEAGRAAYYGNGAGSGAVGGGGAQGVGNMGGSGHGGHGHGHGHASAGSDEWCG